MANTRRKSRSDRFIFLGCSMVTAAIKLKMLTPWRESYGKPMQHINKTETLLADKGLYRKTMVFPVDMYRCESWTIKKAEGQRIDGFELWCWRRFLRFPWTVMRSNLKEINSDYSWEGLILKMKLQYLGHLMWSQLLVKDPDAGKDWRQKEKGTAEE